ncbi:MAG TPA: hypothetical protein DD732_07410 [Rhizobiales bacterium]|jgi:hypothetical protein|nr:hypothetical protein [Hyphomicrobiales bacterium]
MSLIDHAALLAMLDYDPDTGVFVWRQRTDTSPQCNGIHAGKVAGCERTNASGRKYWRIHICGRTFLAHRLAFFWMVGCWPPHEVDHRDNDGLNNKWLNLRPATTSQNGANRGLQSNNTTGMKGVRPGSKLGRYRATININRKQYHLGTYDSPEAAHEVYRKASVAAFGEYARMK